MALAKWGVDNQAHPVATKILFWMGFLLIGAGFVMSLVGWVGAWRYGKKSGLGRAKAAVWSYGILLTVFVIALIGMMRRGGP